MRRQLLQNHPMEVAKGEDVGNSTRGHTRTEAATKRGEPDKKYPKKRKWILFLLPWHRPTHCDPVKYLSNLTQSQTLRNLKFCALPRIRLHQQSLGTTLITGKHNKPIPRVFSSRRATFPAVKKNEVISLEVGETVKKQVTMVGEMVKKQVTITLPKTPCGYFSIFRPIWEDETNHKPKKTELIWECFNMEGVVLQNGGRCASKWRALRFKMEGIVLQNGGHSHDSEHF